ncbi:MAG: Xaa-Pro peptidase family protein [Proteobacteria bacterium]|nr:Xaa-Pro peptidase family protein [Pseudomonadota bacterium]
MAMFARGEHEHRLERLRRKTAAAGADVLIVDEAELLCWLTGYMASETMYRAALVPLDGAPWFVLRALDEDVCRKATWFEDVIGHLDDEDPLDVIAESLAARGYGAAAIAADFHSYSFTASLAARFRALLPDARWINIEGISGTIRTIKSPAEVEAIAQAARVADETMAAVCAWARAGVTSREAYAHAAGEFVRRGADNGKVGIVVKGQGDSEFLHAGVSDEPLGPGDILHVELVPTVGGYGARLMRPIAIGDPGDARRRAAARLIALQDAQIAAMRPGVPAVEIDAMLRRPVMEEGLRPRFDNTCGYTLGLYGWTPRISDFTRNFHPGATWSLEAAQVFHMVLSAQGLGFSESVAVTTDGPRLLTRTPRAILASGA